MSSFLTAISVDDNPGPKGRSREAGGSTSSSSRAAIILLRAEKRRASEPGPKGRSREAGRSTSSSSRAAIILLRAEKRRASAPGPPPEFLPESNKEKRRKTKLVVSDPVSVVSDPVSVATAEDWLEMRRAVHNRKLAGSSMHGWYMHEEDDEDTDSEALVDFMMYGLCLSINKERLG